jgi:hypothetical protein
MDAVEESKKLLVIKEDIYNTKMDILKGKLTVMEKDKNVMIKIFNNSRIFTRDTLQRSVY